MEKISQQIVDWSEYLVKCRAVFVRAPKHQKFVMLKPLHEIIEDKTVIRPCPCPMHKPRFKEVVRMFQKIYSVKVLKQIEEVELKKVNVTANATPDNHEVLKWKKYEKRERQNSIGKNDTTPDSDHNVESHRKEKTKKEKSPKKHTKKPKSVSEKTISARKSNEGKFSLHMMCCSQCSNITFLISVFRFVAETERMERSNVYDDKIK